MRTTCKVCDQPLDGAHKVYCKACWAEYNRQRRANNPDEHRESVNKFRANNPGYDAKWLRERYANNPEFWNEYHREWREQHPDEVKVFKRKSHLKSLYGLTQEDVLAALEAQSGLCLICGVEMETGRGARSMTVDHDHETGEFRGLTCSNCNRGLGLFGDDPDRLTAAAAYLIRHSMKRQER